MSMRTRPPDFFVVGAQKSGTTTLHDQLAKCELVNLPITKETHYFSDDNNYTRGLDWYYKQFPSSTSFIKRGEVAPDYLFSEQAPARIKSLTSTPEIICLFRNPIERAHSNYLMAVRNGYETLTFYDALLAEGERISNGDIKNLQLFSYLGRSLYGKQISHYLKILPDAKYLFTKFEDFTSKGSIGHETHQRICDFIGLPQCLPEFDLSTKSNAVSKPRSSFLRNQLYNPSWAKRTLRLLIPSYDLRARIAYKLDKLNQRPILKSPIGNVPSETINRLLDDLEIFQRLTDIDITNWKIGISSHNQRK